MKDQHKNEMKVGITVLAGLTILVVGFAVFKGWSSGSSLYVVHIRFPVSSGLQTGDQVFVNGVKAGKVKMVTLERNSVLVDAYIDKIFILDSDASARIQMLELMGGKKVEITQGTSGAVLASDAVLRGFVDPDISGALGMVGGLEGKVKDISTNANTLLINSNNILGDSAFIASIKETITNLRDVSRQLKPMIGENRTNVHELSSLLVALTKRVDTLMRSMGPKLDRSLGDATVLLHNADTLVTEVNGLIRDIKSNKSLISSALYDTTMTTRMSGLLSKLDTLSNLILQGNFKTRIKIF